MDSLGSPIHRLISNRYLARAQVISYDLTHAQLRLDLAPGLRRCSGRPYGYAPGSTQQWFSAVPTSGGPRAGVTAGLGICSGLFGWGAGAAFGLTALLAASEIAFTIVKWFGAAYLVYLGIKLLLKPR